MNIYNPSTVFQVPMSDKEKIKEEGKAILEKKKGVVK
jgi:hypothetical protein